MAADSLVRLVRFPGRLLFLSFLMVGCKQVSKTQQKDICVDADSTHSYIIEGKLHIHGMAFSGMLFRKYENSSDTEFVSHYTNGLEDGEWKKFYPGNKLREQRFFDHGMKVGVMRSWWENGQLQMLYHFAQDEYEGSCSEWNPQGVLVRELNYHRGHEEGSQRQWYDNGTVRSNYVVKNGRRFGLLGTKNCVNVADSIAFDK